MSTEDLADAPCGVVLVRVCIASTCIGDFTGVFNEIPLPVFDFSLLAAELGKGDLSLG